MKRRLMTSLLVLACAPALGQQSDAALRQAEEADRIQRERQELRERARALEKQLETAKQVREKQDKLIQELQATIRKLQEQRDKQP